MIATRRGRAVSMLFLVPALLIAQGARERQVVPLKPWAAPLLWQPSAAEAQAAGARADSPPAGVTPKAQTPAGALVFVGMTPCRVVDTRAGMGFIGAFGPPSMAGGASRTFPIQASTTCSVPASAQAYSFNVTVVPPGPLIYLTVYPTGQPAPNASTLNSFQGFVVANAAIVPAGTGGSVDVFVSDPTDVIIDINGYYAPQAGVTLAQGSASAPSLSFSGDAGTGIYSGGAGSVSIATGGSNSLTVAANGNVGIGTSSPGAPLQVAPTANRDSIWFGGGSVSYATPPVNGGLVGRGGTSDYRLDIQDGNGRVNQYWNAYVDIPGTPTGPHPDPKYIVSGEGAARQSLNVPGAAIFEFDSAPPGNAGDVINWIALAQLSAGSNIFFSPTGNSADLYITAAGATGFGTTTPRDKVEIDGDLRVGSCVKNIGGTQIAGTCPSDERLKKNIEPFAPVLSKLAQLQPVHFDWRADEFPDYHFGDSRTYGLIAQEVEKQFPELISEDQQGFKSVNYSELPLLLLEGIRDLNAQNRSLQDQNRKLEERLAALEAALAAKSGQ